MKIKPEEIRRVRKTLLLNLVVADLVTLAGLAVYWWDRENQTLGAVLTGLGLVWVILSVLRIVRFRRFLHQKR